MDPVLTGAGLAGAGAYALHWRRRRRQRGLPTDIRILDPKPTREGVFRLGVYLGGDETTWRPWDGGEQHMAIFGTTGSGKSVLAKNLIATAAERMHWDVKVADGKAGNDFAWVRDAGLGLVCTKGAIPTLLGEVAKEIERRNDLLASIRVRRLGPDKQWHAVAPAGLRDLSEAERAAHGLRPMLVVIDELAMLLAAEDSKKKPISGPLLVIAAAGRSVGIHLAALMQRGDADLLDGFIGNLFRARVLAGSTDQVAEGMAHGASAVKVWEEMAEAAGYRPDGLERALRPPGRALVSGLEVRPTAICQLYRFDPISRAPTWDEWSRRSAASAPGSPGADEAASPSGDRADDAGPDLRPALRLVSSSVRSPDYAPRGPVSEPAERPSSSPAAASSSDRPVRPRVPVGLAVRRLGLRLGAWRWIFAPLVPDPPRDPGLRDRVAARDHGVCSICRRRVAEWDAEHTRPLGLGGEDSLSNATTMCRPDHKIKSRAERRVLTVKRRWARIGFSGRVPVPRMALWKWAALVAGLAGFVDGRWAMASLIVLVTFALGPGLVRHYVVPKPWRRGRGNGLDGVSTLDAKLEQQLPGFMGATARSYYRTRLSVLTFRFAVMGAAAVYLLGHLLRARL